MNAGNMLQEMQGIVTGAYALKKTIDVTEQIKGTAGAALSGTTTNVGRGAIETNFDGIVCSASGTAVLSLALAVPRDYDQDLDYCKVKFLAQMGGNTNNDIHIDAALFQKKVATALSADLDPVISGHIPTLASKADWVEIDASSLGLVPGSAIYFEFTTSAHTTDAIHIYAVEFEYKTDLVYYNRADR
jgi:hypothetical protein